ncbi:hypothetical protein OZ410_03045 [Robiginitalea sp. M366]|uniref:hypothetical protein n=1 Tax=Robiginitalea aestuariiviva TaxID=3036903 RepID=UPI00240CF553|nr:hypothetical protein [Robiginitalea aestuariiviva]MDG1571275.1 hypothetical protein [Robiginitalea aestuariiviva]
MKHLWITCALLCLGHIPLQAQTEFELDPNQSMLMYGKGPGQDGTINPYAGEDCYAIVKNLGEVAFSIRIQQKGEIVQTISIKGMETKKVKLLVGQELYLDPETDQMARASVGYEKIPL